MTGEPTLLHFPSGFRSSIKVHFADVLPDLIRQKVTHTFPFADTGADEGGGEGNERRIDRDDGGMPVELAGFTFRTGIEIDFVPVKDHFKVLPFVKGRQDIGTGYQHKLFCRVFLSQPCQRVNSEGRPRHLKLDVR